MYSYFNYLNIKLRKLIYFIAFHSCIEFFSSYDINSMIKLSLTESRPRSKTSEVRMSTAMTLHE